MELKPETIEELLGAWHTNARYKLTRGSKFEGNEIRTAIEWDSGFKFITTHTKNPKRLLSFSTTFDISALEVYYNDELILGYGKVPIPGLGEYPYTFKRGELIESDSTTIKHIKEILSKTHEN